MADNIFKKTGSDDFPDKLKGLLSGMPKSGKTSFLGTVPNLIIADTEPFANNLQSVAHLDIPYVTIDSTDKLRQLQFMLADDSLRAQVAQNLGLPEVGGVAIDTMDTLQKLMKKERMRETRQTKFLRDDWGWLKTEMEAIVEGFNALPMHVFFTVHLKNQEIGTEDNPKSMILPGLEGAIANSIAGMVGYSLLSFRKEEQNPDGSRYTKYWLQAEGDETYQFLGNRAAGRLPDIIEPNFKAVYDAAMAGRPSKQATAIAPIEIQTTGQTPPQAAIQPPAQEQQAPAPPAPAQTQGQAQPSAERPPDDEPVNQAALQHVKKVYDALEQVFPEEKIKALTLGQARGIVMMFRAAQQDAAEGKGGDAKQVAMEFLTGQGWVADADQPQEPAEAQVVPDVRGTIPQVKAYVGNDLARANEAFEIERTGANRKGLMEWLESKGARHGGAPASPEFQEGHPQDGEVPVQTDVQNPAPSEPEEAVTPEAPAADADPTEQEAVEAAIQGLGATVLVDADAKCEDCGKQIDDVDLAELGVGRFNKILCVEHYLAHAKASKA